MTRARVVNNFNRKLNEESFYSIISKISLTPLKLSWRNSSLNGVETNIVSFFYLPFNSNLSRLYIIQVRVPKWFTVIIDNSWQFLLTNLPDFPTPSKPSTTACTFTMLLWCVEQDRLRLIISLRQGSAALKRDENTLNKHSKKSKLGTNCILIVGR